MSTLAEEREEDCEASGVEGFAEGRWRGGGLFFPRREEQRGSARVSGGVGGGVRQCVHCPYWTRDAHQVVLVLA